MQYTLAMPNCLLYKLRHEVVYHCLDLIKYRMENQRGLNNRDRNLQNMETLCDVCHTVPCFVYQFQEQVIASCEVMEITRRCNDDVPPLTNNERRKWCYKEFTRAIYGSLGKGNRVRLPACVLEFVRNKYPDQNHAYMGFKEM